MDVLIGQREPEVRQVWKVLIGHERPNVKSVWKSKQIKEERMFDIGEISTGQG